MGRFGQSHLFSLFSQSSTSTPITPKTMALPLAS